MRERRNNILGDGMRGRFDEMETIAAANVMRMRRGKRQYRRTSGMGSLPVVLAKVG